MKKIFLIIAFLFTATVQFSFGQNSVPNPGLDSLLLRYYDVKNALVSSDAKLAAASALAFSKAVDAVDISTLSDADQKAFKSSSLKLKEDAGSIAASGKIDVQRVNFSSLSNHTYALAKSVKLSPSPIYQQYCPMKKAYWLSMDPGIKNPYYGSAMLTCGKVSDTIKPTN